MTDDLLTKAGIPEEHRAAVHASAQQIASSGASTYEQAVGHIAQAMQPRPDTTRLAAIAAALATLSPQERAQRLDATAPKPPSTLSAKERQHRKVRNKIATRSRRINRGRR